MLFHCCQSIEQCGKVVLPLGKKLVLLCDYCFVVKDYQLFWVVHSWPLHISHALVKTFGVIRACKCLEFTPFYQPPFILSSLHHCRRSIHVFYFPLADLVFLPSILYQTRFLLLISSFSSVLFPSNQSICFLTVALSFSLDTWYMVNLKAFHFSYTVPAGISACLQVIPYSVDLVGAGCELPDRHFAFPHSPLHSL